MVDDTDVDDGEAGMARQLDFSWVYPLPPLAVFQMATRLEHLHEKAEYLGHEGHAVKELRERGGVFRSVSERTVDAEIPWYAGIVKYTKLNRITQTQLWHPSEWDGHRVYETRVEVAAVPATITGWGSLTPLDWNRTRYDIHLDVVSRAWLVGGIVETNVAKNLQTAIDGEHEFREVWLGRTLRR